MRSVRLKAPIFTMRTCGATPLLRRMQGSALPGVVRSMSSSSRLKKWKTKKTGKSLKTRRAAAKRFILTGKGKLKRGSQGKRHNTSAKSMVQLRRLNKMKMLDGTKIARNMQKLIIR